MIYLIMVQIGLKIMVGRVKIMVGVGVLGSQLSHFSSGAPGIKCNLDNRIHCCLHGGGVCEEDCFLSETTHDLQESSRRIFSVQYSVCSPAIFPELVDKNMQRQLKGGK